MGKPHEGHKRVVIENVEPQINCGRFPIKRIAGESVEVEADVFTDGHDHVWPRLLWKRREDAGWHIAPMAPLGNDRWRGQFPVVQVGGYLYTIAAEIDRFGTWSSDLKKRFAAGQDLSVALQIGGTILEEAAAAAAPAPDAAVLAEWARQLKRNADDRRSATVQKMVALVLDDRVAETLRRYPGVAFETRFEREFAVSVDRERAGFSSWYELFPRSWSATPGEHGTLRDVVRYLDYVAAMNFDVLYLPPIHPIGESFRKGKNNAVTAEAGDVGSPWAIGSRQGGHTAIHPRLGTMGDFDLLVKRARDLGLEIALDIAFQSAPDHPWVTEHPKFFKWRPDGSIQYAENPPKKYQDIYPFDFESAEWPELWEQLKEVFRFWMKRGVRIFRVDNPHTKPFAFWEWAIGELKTEQPDVLFLAEAFTRPRVMERLAKLGFSQSYTYFAWRNTKEELTGYMLELTQSPLREFLRPSFWPNTPDILTEALQTGGLPAFRSRLILAGTLSSNYGVYGPAFELGVNTAASPGSEEYLNSEKYEIKTWNLDHPQSLSGLIGRLNRARRENRALQSNRRLHFHEIANPQLLCYSKSTEDGENTILVVVNLDAFSTQSGWVDLQLNVLGLEPDQTFEVEDLLMDRRYPWRGSRNYVELRPHEMPAHIFRLRKRTP